MLPLFPLLLSLLLPVHGLSPFLSHYEPLNYSTSDLARVSRSARPQDTVRLQFDAFNRTFKLRLVKISPEESVFLKDATIQLGNETINIDREANIYKGSVDGDSSSRVFGSMHEGMFSGVIETGDGKEYGVEHSIGHNSSAPFHSFIYDVDHIKKPNKTKTKRSDGSLEAESMCALSDPDIAKSLKQDESPSPSPSVPPSSRSTRNAKSKRTSGQVEKSKKDKDGIYDYRLCSLNIHVDHLLFNYYIEKKTKKDDDSIKRRLQASQLLSDLVTKEVHAVNQVYGSTDFGKISGIKFAIGDLKIWKDEKDSANPYKEENLEVKAFLAINAKQDHRGYCLGYVMTYRDFAGGTLGLAYVGGLGITYKPSSTTQKSTNTGIVTYLNHGAPVLERISYLTLAHEIGHNFGANHDEAEECFGKDGQYIMYYAATSGDKQNNRKFSDCSISSMSKRLHEIMKLNPNTGEIVGGDRNPFIALDSAFCGNGIKEDGEECDCGREQSDCDEKKDKCCHPANAGELKCTLKINSETGKKYHCAPSQGPCCNEECKFKDDNTPCAASTDCTAAVNCKAKDSAAKCPTAKKTNRGNPCMDATGICEEGECNQSIMCVNANLTECESKEKSCMRHCEYKGECKPTSEIPVFADKKYKQEGRWGHAGVMLRPMSQCMAGKGTCDQFDICKSVTAKGSISKTFEKVKDFGDMMVSKIWILIIAIIVVLIVLIVVIKFCSYATPSSNPNKPKAKSIKQIKNMMSDRVKRISNKRKPRKGKAATSAATPNTVQTPVDMSKEKTKETNDEEE